jgi:uncharacterized membrane protein YfcA
MFDPLLISLGLFVGTIVGLTRIGGGALLTPLLILVVGVRPTIAVGTEWAFAAVTKWACRGPKTRGQTPAQGGLPGIVLGSWLCSSLPNRPLRVSIATMLDLAGVRLL